MAVVTKSIGTSSRDYSTLQSWEDAIPANLVTDGNSYVGEAYNDSEFTATVDISAHTTDSSHTLTLTVASGQSFYDNANVRTNALRYNQSNGVGVKRTQDYETVIGISGIVDYFTLSRFQLKTTATTGSQITGTPTSADHVVFQDLVCESNCGVMGQITSPAKLINILAISLGTAGHAFGALYTSPTLINCTAIRPSDISVASNGFTASDYSTVTLINCASFGFTNATTTLGSGAFTGSCTNNATDHASGANGMPGANAQHSVSYTSATPFTDGAAATLDCRAIAATALAGNGAKDATNAPNDISGTVRATACTIGVWELAAAAGFQYARPVSDVSVGNWTASSGTDRFAMVDEATADDADYITSGASPANDECVLALGALSTPAAGTVTLRVRAKYV